MEKVQVSLNEEHSKTHFLSNLHFLVNFGKLRCQTKCGLEDVRITGVSKSRL